MPNLYNSIVIIRCLMSCNWLMFTMAVVLIRWAGPWCTIVKDHNHLYTYFIYFIRNFSVSLDVTDHWSGPIPLICILNIALMYGNKICSKYGLIRTFRVLEGFYFSLLGCDWSFDRGLFPRFVSSTWALVLGIEFRSIIRMLWSNTLKSNNTQIIYIYKHI